MISTNIAICLVTVATNFTPVSLARVDPTTRNPQYAAIPAGWPSPDNLYRLSVTTNYQYVTGLHHKVFDAIPSGRFTDSARCYDWIKYCTCPCHGWHAVIHDTLQEARRLKTADLGLLLLELQAECGRRANSARSWALSRSSAEVPE